MTSVFSQNLLALLPLIISALIVLMSSAYFFIKYWLLYSKIASVPLTKAVQAKQGIISIEGMAQPYSNESVSGPSKKPCVWYHITMRRWNRDWLPKRDYSKAPFIVKDDTGSIIINLPENFCWEELQLINKDSWCSDSPTDPQLITLFGAANRAPGIAYQWTELRIEKNQNVYIYGVFKRAPQSGSIYGEIYKPISTAPLIISDLPRTELLRHLATKIFMISPCFAGSIIFASFVVYELIRNG